MCEGAHRRYRLELTGSRGISQHLTSIAQVPLTDFAQFESHARGGEPTLTDYHPSFVPTSSSPSIDLRACNPSKSGEEFGTQV